MQRHPDFVLRADFKGDLRASVMASLAFDEGAGESELALAAAAGGSRAQIRKALDNLEMTGRVRRHRSKAGTRIELLVFQNS
jgi:DNA-binding GntR family transcriptional regulator